MPPRSRKPSRRNPASKPSPSPPSSSFGPLLPEELSRRLFVQHLTFWGGGVVLLGASCKKPEPAQAPGGPLATGRPKVLTTSHRTFTREEYEVMAAAAERVLPKDEDPGALDANVPKYIDRMLATPEMAKIKEDFLGGTAALQRRAQRMFNTGFAQATPAQQDELLTLFKTSPQGSGEARFYELLVVLTLEGFLGDPSYGGNKDKVGWALMGFDVIGSQAMAPSPGYDGTRHLHHETSASRAESPSHDTGHGGSHHDGGH